MSEFIEFAARVNAVGAPARLRPIIESTAKIFQRDIVRAAPRDTGALQETIVAQLVRNQNVAAGYTTVRAKAAIELRNERRRTRGRAEIANKARYPFIVAAGAAAHVIRAKNGKALLVAGRTPVSEVSHPGLKRNDYFGRGTRSAMPRAKSFAESEVKYEFEKLKAEYGV